MVAITITKGHLKNLAQGVIDGTAKVDGCYLLTAAFATALISKPKAAEIIGVQVNQVGKFTSPSNGMPRKAVKALAYEILAAS